MQMNHEEEYRVNTCFKLYNNIILNYVFLNYKFSIMARKCINGNEIQLKDPSSGRHQK